MKQMIGMTRTKTFRTLITLVTLKLNSYVLTSVSVMTVSIDLLISARKACPLPGAVGPGVAKLTLASAPWLLIMHRIILTATFRVVVLKVQRYLQSLTRNLAISGVTKVLRPTFTQKTENLVLCPALRLRHNLLITVEMPGPSSFAFKVTSSRLT